MNNKQIFQVSFLFIFISAIRKLLQLVLLEFDSHFAGYFGHSILFPNYRPSPSVEVSYLHIVGLFIFMMGIFKKYDSARIPAIIISIYACKSIFILDNGWLASSQRRLDWLALFNFVFSPFVYYVIFVLPLFLLLFNIFKDEKFNRFRNNILFSIICIGIASISSLVDVYSNYNLFKWPLRVFHYTWWFGYYIGLLLVISTFIKVSPSLKPKGEIEKNSKVTTNIFSYLKGGYPVISKIIMFIVVNAGLYFIYAQLTDFAGLTAYYNLKSAFVYGKLLGGTWGMAIAAGEYLPDTHSFFERFNVLFAGASALFLTMLINKRKVISMGQIEKENLQENKTTEKLVVSKKPESIDMENELEKFKSMLDKGLISEEDYELKKKDILGL